MSDGKRRVLFVQVTEAGAYPPIIHASTLMALAGWDVTILNAPVAGYNLTVPQHPGITIRNVASRPSHILGKVHYLRYVLAASRLAVTFRPNVVYASDPFGAGPGLAAARLANATLVYHEHDTPAPGTLNLRIARTRTAAARKSKLVIFPNAERARIAQAEMSFRNERLHVISNMPRRVELPKLSLSRQRPIVLHYHGNISPELLPECVLHAMVASQTRARLRIMGYEAPGASGYLARLLELGKRAGSDRVEYLGQVSRDRLLTEASQGTIGLALLPRSATDVNLKHAVGASNKVFDYMASGLALLVPDSSEWRRAFVEPGYGRACDPSDSGSIASQLAWFAQNPEELRSMGAKGRAKIESDWNYETFFSPVLASLNEIAA